jgi:hypothetical protein
MSTDTENPTPPASRRSVVLRWLVPVVAGIAIGALVLVLVPFLRGETPTSDPSSVPIATDSPTASSTPSAGPTASPAPPTASPEPTVTPAESDAYITTAGYGEIKLGRPVPQDTDLLEWQQVYDGCGYWTPTGGSGAFYTKNKTSKVLSIELWEGSTLKTKSGAHLGMRRADLEKLFPKAAHPDDRLYIVKDNLGQVVFDVENDEVAYIRVVPTSQKVSATGGHGICD